jgi:hypothetical protein
VLRGREGEPAGVRCVDCRDYAGVILEFVEVRGCCGARLGERVCEKWVVRAKGQVVDDVREVKLCVILVEGLGKGYGNVRHTGMV